MAAYARPLYRMTNSPGIKITQLSLRKRVELDIAVERDKSKDTAARDPILFDKLKYLLYI